MKLNRWLMLSAVVFGGALALACGSDDDDLGSGGTAATGGASGAAGSGGAAGQATGGTGGSAGQATGGTAGSAGDAGSGGSAGEAGSAGQAGSGGGAAGTAGTGGGNTDAGVTCDIQTGLAACDACINTECINECNTCAAKPACMAIWTCITTDCVDGDGGTDADCAKACATSNLGGLVDFAAFFQGLTPGCVVNKCSAVCPS